MSGWMKYVWGRLAYSRDKVFQINLSHNAHFSRTLCAHASALINSFIRVFITRNYIFIFTLYIINSDIKRLY